MQELVAGNIITVFTSLFCAEMRQQLWKVKVHRSTSAGMNQMGVIVRWMDTKIIVSMSRVACEDAVLSVKLYAGYDDICDKIKSCQSFFFTLFSASLQVRNLNTCLTFLAELGVDVDGLNARGRCLYLFSCRYIAAIYVSPFISTWAKCTTTAVCRYRMKKSCWVWRHGETKLERPTHEWLCNK